MWARLFAVVSNTFTETLRQPIYGVVVGIAILFLALSPSLVMFTLDDDNQLLKDINLSTLLVAGLFLAIFSAAGVVTEEIDNKTILTVISKTVSRPLFIVGKFLGLAGAVILALYLLSLVFLMTVRHGVLMRSGDKTDYVVITFGYAAGLITVLVGLAGNYFYRWRFTSTAALLGSILATLVIILLFCIDSKWQYHPAAQNLNLELIGPILLIMIASLIFTAIAVAVATRLGLVLTLIICILLFVLGNVVNFWLGPIAAQSGISSYLAWIALAVVPAINIFVVTNAIYEGTAIPLSYIGQTALYAFIYVSAALLFAIALFRRREIG